MHVLLAPDAVGPLDAVDVARALAAGWSSAAPRDVLDLCPLPDAGLAGRVARCALVVTGEDVFDAASLLGSPAGTAARLAQEAGVPCVVLAGQVHVGRREAAARGVDEALSLADAVGAQAAAAEPARHLADLAARAARAWSTG